MSSSLCGIIDCTSLSLRFIRGTVSSYPTPRRWCAVHLWEHKILDSNALEAVKPLLTHSPLPPWSRDNPKIWGEFCSFCTASIQNSPGSTLTVFLSEISKTAKTVVIEPAPHRSQRLSYSCYSAFLRFPSELSSHSHNPILR